MGTLVNVGAARESMPGSDILRPARNVPNMTSAECVCWARTIAHAPRTMVEIVMLDPWIMASGKGISFWFELRACGVWSGEGKAGNCRAFELVSLIVQ